MAFINKETPNMKYFKLVIFVVVIFSFGFKYRPPILEKKTVLNNDSIEMSVKKIWDESSFKEIVSYDLFQMAMKGYYKYDSFEVGKISIIDYSKPSSVKRFYVIDLKNKSLLFNTLIAHGKNTGENKAIHFSNKPKSLKSSLGFFKTSETYYGKHGYSMKLDGLEKGINDNARKRAIVIHGANYVSAEFVLQNGRLGRSWGCPALPVSKTKKVIDAINNGTCLFIYGKNEEYLKVSEFLN